MIYVGIDPGNKGAIAALNEAGELVIYRKFPEFLDWSEVYKMFRDFGSKLNVAIERIWGDPLWSSTTNCSLCGNYHRWLLCLELLKVPHITPAPVTWQKQIFNIKGRKKRAETKVLSLKYVNKKFDLKLPMKTKKNIDENSGVSDAICIALFGKLNATN